jgi:8-oxo-dGTP pyrophosphatase MutT (NUDIX family)
VSPWQTRASRTVYENRWINVREDRVSRPDGGEGIYGVVTVRNPAVFVVPVTDDDRVVLVRMFRYTMGRETLEIPAGGTDGEDPLVAAQRELQEETGFAAAEWQRLGPMFSLNGVADAPGHAFLARGLRRVGGHAMDEEGILGVETLPWSDLTGMIRDGRIEDGETLAALMYAAVALGKLG